MESSIKIYSLRTRGIKANGERCFEVRLRGKEVYSLLTLLEELAVRESAYLEVRSAVYFAETIREQVNEQGF